jgi:hypothetical protein
MSIEFRVIEGSHYASQASELLSLAWRPPALHYSPEYVHWLLSFPGPGDAPAAAAFDGSRFVGFAASVHRRLRHGSRTTNALVVTLVAVHPDARNRGVAGGLYASLLGAIRDAPLFTFALDNSAGERAIRSSYRKAGWELRCFGEYPNSATVLPQTSFDSEWREVSSADAPATLRAAIDACAADPRQLWNHPDDAQLEHYFRDPRGRRLLMRRSEEGSLSAAWALPIEFVSPDGIQSVLTIDSVWMPHRPAGPLRSLVAAIASLWPSMHGVVNAPNLLSFDPADLRRVGFRQVGSRFRGYSASLPGWEGWEGCEGSNLEII